ncbi:MAG: cbb3-type cytochrome oxidase assembly protein CcoS [Desulfobacteraceae bacterium]|jgi:cbb3-type cytochrome oxidase maturation protein
MYFPYFIAYIVIGISISLLVFFWAVKTGQFHDQQRARYLPLRGEPAPGPAKASRVSRWEIYGLFFLAAAGLAATAALLLFAAYSRHG